MIDRTENVEIKLKRNNDEDKTVSEGDKENI